MREFVIRVRGQNWTVKMRAHSYANVARGAALVLGLEEELPIWIEVRAAKETFFDKFWVWIDRRGGLRVDVRPL